MIVLGAVTASSPLLHQDISKERIDIARKTVQSINEIKSALHSANVDTVVHIGSHREHKTDVFHIHADDPIVFDVSEFADTQVARHYADLSLITEIQSNLRAEFDVRLCSGDSLHFGAGIPLSLLATESFSLVPITHSSKDVRTHHAFGRALFNILQASTKRIAVILSTDLSHALNDDSPVAANDHGTAFDELMLHALTHMQESAVLNAPDEMLVSAQQQADRLIALFIGIMKKANLGAEILSYEAPFGVGFPSILYRLP
jgi:aromatic ring-opening dioxygenase LigB subunit